MHVWACVCRTLILLAASHVQAELEVSTRRSFEIPAWEPDLGNFSFQITTRSPSAQKLFNVGVLFLYNFDQPNARTAFQAALEVDEDCAMCAWGVAHSCGPFLNRPSKGADELALGYAAAQNASKLLSRRRSEYSAKEQAFIDAMAIRYPENPQTGNQSQTYKDYALRIRALRNNSDIKSDADLMVFDAEAMMVLMCDAAGYHFYAPRGDDLPPVERPETAEASSLLRSALSATKQTHPYAQHLLIHSTEMSNSEAETAVQVASTLLKNMKGLQSQHLQHMTSHTYQRAGYYHRAAIANELAVKSDAAYMHHHLLPYGPGHNSAFLVTSAMWGGERQKAQKYAQVMQQIFTNAPGRRDGPDGSKAWGHPMLVELRFGNWTRVSQVDVKPPSNFSKKWPYGYGVVRDFSLAVADAHLGRRDEAWAHFASLQKHMRNVAATGDLELTNVSLIANHTASAVLAQADGKTTIALQALQDAVDVELGMPYDEPPPWLLPTRECLGQALMDNGFASDAERVFRSALYGYSWHAEPNCGWALFGLRASLQRQVVTPGRKEEIKNLTRQIDRVWQHADVPLTAACLHVSVPTRPATFV